MGLFSETNRPTSSPRVTDVLFERNQRTFGSLAALPSNVEAIEAALLFSAGLNTLVTLVGPSGWGKSHLLEAVVYRLSRGTGEASEIRTAADYLGTSSRIDPATLIIDDAQEVLQRTRQRQMLRLALERRVRANKPTMLAFTLPKPTRQLRSFLPSQREWTVATMGVPEADERILLLNQLAKAEGLALSPVLTKIIALQMHGNGRTLAGAMKRLRLAAPTWLDARGTLKACGLLNPFFADNSAWDLNHKILLIADATRAQFSRVATLDLACYVMLREASLSEADVARAARIAPGDAYARANRFAKLIGDSYEARESASQFIEIVVSTLASE